MDTLRYYESLVAAGSNENEAKAHVYALNDAMTNLATKSDLENAIKVLDVKITTQFNIIERVGFGFCLVMFGLLLKVAVWG